MPDEEFWEGHRRKRRAGVAEFRGPLFGAFGPGLSPPWFNGGRTSNGIQRSLKIESPGAQRWFDVTVETMLDEGPWPEETVLWHLLGADVEDPPAFPVTSTVRKGKLPVRIAGRRRPLTVYVCGASWLVRTRSAGRWLWIHGSATDPRTIDIVRLGDSQVAAALDLSDAVTQWMSDRTQPNPIRSDR